MLIYANKLAFDANGGTHKIIEQIAKWVGSKSRGYIAPDRLAEGIRELRLKDGSALSSISAFNDNEPFLFCAKLTHGDYSVSGRLWTTEVGLFQQDLQSPIECSIILKTDEVSARVNDAITVTRPRIVQLLIENCQPVSGTPGLRVKQLTAESGIAFLSDVERLARDYPLVLVSTDQQGNHPVNLDRLLSVLAGLADVVEIPADVNTFELQEVIGRRYIAFGGAINIIFPVRQNYKELICQTIKLKTNDIEDIVNDGKSIDSEILSAITHRTNLPYSWKHISKEVVNQARLRTQLAKMIERSKSNGHAEELAEYTALLEVADEEARSRYTEVEQLRCEYDAKNNEVIKLQATIDGLKYALNGQQESFTGVSNELVESLNPFKDSIKQALWGSLSLSQVLDLIQFLFSEEVIILDSAFESAKNSDQAGFKLTGKAFDLLRKLATEYRSKLVEGKSDQQAKSCFGHNVYAANEADTLSIDGKRRRTFKYQSTSYFMEKHLKHGVKDSAAETLRIHFEWIPSENKILIGHCGKHLDF